MSWRAFVVRFLAVVLGGSALLFVALALLNPWGTLPFRSPAPRYPADHSQRWAYPEIARDPRFNGVIMGDSASRLIDPALIDPVTGVRFANIAILHGFAWEQGELLDVYLRAHPAPAAVMVGLDQVWCQRGDDAEHYGYGPLPEWLYDGDWVESLGNLLNLHAIDTAAQSLRTVFGINSRPWGENGWTLLDVDHHPYDPALARSLISENLAQPWPKAPGPDPAQWRYIALEWLRQRLDRLPPSTRTLLVFVPSFHLYPAPGSDGAAMMDECKRRVVALARSRANTEVYDFAIPSALTREESNWWDAVHLRPESAQVFSRQLATALAGGAGEGWQVLFRPASSVVLGERAR